MIFKQYFADYISDFTGITAIGKAINEINSLKLDVSNISGYAKAVQNLDLRQAELVLTTKGLNEAQREAVLTEAGLLATTGELTTAQITETLTTEARTAAEAKDLAMKTGLIVADTEESTATNVITAAKLEELVATKALTKAEAELIAKKAGINLQNSVSLLGDIKKKIVGLGTGLKGLGTGVMAVASAHPVIASIIAITAACGGAALVAKAKHEAAAKAIKEAYDNAKTSIENIQSNLETTTSKTDEIKEEYAELAQGVDLLTNSNKNLSSENYERFLDLSNELSTLYPSLTQSYDENGNAILNLSGDVDTIVGSLDNLISRQQQLANLEIIEQMPDLFKGYVSNVSSYKKELNEVEKTQSNIQAAYDKLMEAGVNPYFELSGDAKSNIHNFDWYKNLLNEIGVEVRQIRSDVVDGVLTTKITTLDGADITEQMVHDSYVTAYNKATEDVKYAKQQLENETSSINEYLNTWLQSEFTYNQIGDSGLQKAIQDMLFNFDWDSLPEGIDSNDWEEVSEYLRRNILFAIKDVQGNEEISNALSAIFTNAELDPDDKINYIKQIQDYFGEDNVISIALQPKLEETETLQSALEEAINEFDDIDLSQFFKENSINTSEELDYWNEVTEGAKTAAEAVDMYNKSKEEAATEISFTDTVTKLDEITKGFNAISTAYTNIQKNGKFEFSDISSITENLGDLEGLETYIQNIQNAVGNAEQLKIAVTDLTNAYIEQSGILDNLNEGNASLIAAFLEEQGVTNATAVVQNQLALNMAEAAAKTGDFTDATWNNIAAQLEECGALENVGVSVADLQTAYVTAQSAMSAAVSSGALARLGVLQKELEGIQTLAEAYALLGGSRLSSLGNTFTDTSGNERVMSSADLFQETPLTTDESVFIAAAQGIINVKDSINALKIDTNVGAGGGGGGGSSGGSGGSGSGSSSTPKTNDNYYNYREAQIEDYKKSVEKTQNEIEKIDEEMAEALENNDYELYQQKKAEREQLGKNLQDDLAKFTDSVRNSLSPEMYEIVYKAAPELEGQTVDEWSEQTLLDIQKRFDDKIVEMENSGI